MSTIDTALINEVDACVTLAPTQKDSLKTLINTEGFFDETQKESLLGMVSTYSKAQDGRLKQFFVFIDAKVEEAIKEVNESDMSDADKELTIKKMMVYKNCNFGDFGVTE